MKKFILLILFDLLFFAVFVNAVDYYAISVEIQGNGYVSSVPSGILCGAACNESYSAGTEITLTAIPNSDATFQNWSGACNGTQNTCTVALTEAKNVIAIFSGQTFSEYELIVYRKGGLGRVTSEPVGIYCGSICAYDIGKFSAGTNVVLTAEETTVGVQFVRWEGDCTGTEKNCTVNLNSKKTVTAVFTGGENVEQGQKQDGKSSETIIQQNQSSTTVSSILPEKYLLNIEIGGNGIGKVSALDYNVDCSETCTREINELELVTLTAAPSSDSVFMGWSNQCSGNQSNCTLSFNSSKNVKAVFEKSSSIQAETGNGGILKNSGKKILQNPEKKTHQVWVHVTGKGRVLSDGNEIDCTESGENCVGEFEEGAKITLNGIPELGNNFARWEGDCFDTVAKCNLTIDNGKNVWIAFYPVFYYLSVELVALKKGAGSGTVSSNDGRIFCPGNCVQQYSYGSNITLNAYPETVNHTFEGWNGDCNGNQNGCNLTMADSRNVSASFRGPTWEYNIVVNAQGSGKVSDSKGFDCRDSNCSKKFELGTTITLKAEPDEGHKFEGWTGLCVGNNPSCTFVVNWNGIVGAKFAERKFYSLKVDKRVDGKVFSVDKKIDCGDICMGSYESGTTVLLRSDREVRWENCTFEWMGDCQVTVDSDKVVETGLTWQKEDELIAKATGEVFVGPEFEGIPYLKEYLMIPGGIISQKTKIALRSKKMGTKFENIKVWMEQNKSEMLNDKNLAEIINGYYKRAVKRTLKEVFSQEINENNQLQYLFESENGKPFQAAFADLIAKKNGGGMSGLKSWLSENKQWYLENTGILDYLVIGIARMALFKVFATEVAESANLAYYFNNADNPPITQAVIDLRAKKGGIGLQGLIKWISENKQWYIDNTGIAKYLEKPEPPKLPQIESIHPENFQITKPTIIVGKNFINVKKVSVDGKEVGFKVNSQENEIKLQDVVWGLNGNPTVRIDTETGWASAPMFYLNEKVTLNGDGKAEQCFGAVGKRCTGAGFEFFWGSHLVALQVGCDKEIDGQRRCWVAVGSIKHDNCCTLNPGGKQCGGLGTDGNPAGENNHNGKCVEEYEAAQWDVFWRRAWTHDFPVGSYLSDLTPAKSPFNRLPNYEARESTILCAPSGHELREITDAAFCCSGKMDSGKKCV